MIELTHEPLDTAAILGGVSAPEAGAVLLFLGTTRERTAGRQTRWLDYECYPEMARAKLVELETEARRRWPLVDCTIVHRLGRVEVGQPSVAVAVSAAHRDAAFEAGKWLIDTLKEVVPIWKQEHWSDGTSQWIHPGVDAGQSVEMLDGVAAARAVSARDESEHVPAVERPQSLAERCERSPMFEGDKP